MKNHKYNLFTTIWTEENIYNTTMFPSELHLWNWIGQWENKPEEEIWQLHAAHSHNYDQWAEYP